MSLDDRAAVAMNFSWIEEGRLAACRAPRTDPELAFLSRAGIKALVSLANRNETGLSAEEIRCANLVECYEPVRDFSAPTQGQIDRVVGFLRGAMSERLPAAVSCGAGYGRTGTILACYLVSSGLTAEGAIEKLIALRPQAGEIRRVLGQAAAVSEFARRTRPSP